MEAHASDVVVFEDEAPAPPSPSNAFGRRVAWVAPGRSVAASLESTLWNLKMGGFLSEYDEQLGRTVAGVITGGDVPSGTIVSEQWFLELEREAFLSLCAEPKTLERIEHMLKSGTPPRN